MAFHGIQIKRERSGIRPVRTVLQSLIAAVGTAPSADVDGAFGDGSRVLYNEPHYLTSRQDAADADLGTDGSLFTALNGIFQAGTGTLSDGHRPGRRCAECYRFTDAGD